MGWVNHSSDINTLIDENEEFADFFDEIESDFLDGFIEELKDIMAESAKIKQLD